MSMLAILLSECCVERVFTPAQSGLVVCYSQDDGMYDGVEIWDAKLGELLKTIERA
jgi:hypothetical protein